MRYAVGTKVLVDLYGFSTRQLGTIVDGSSKGVREDEGYICIHFDNPQVTERYRCNNIGEFDRGFVIFSDIDHAYSNFRLRMVHSAVLKKSLEAAL
jgi:hypothetical protein